MDILRTDETSLATYTGQRHRLLGPGVRKSASAQMDETDEAQNNSNQGTTGVPQKANFPPNIRYIYEIIFFMLYWTITEILRRFERQMVTEAKQ